MNNIISEYYTKLRKIFDFLYTYRINKEPFYVRRVVNNFHKLYYNTPTWDKTFWLGNKTLKCPLDLWVYQELFYEVKPDIIIECGTRHGGSAFFMASICDLLKKGRIVSIDIEELKGRPKHPRVTYLIGSSTSEDVIKKIKKLISGKKRIIVFLDSDHSKKHVLSELKLYSKFVTKNSYLVVEDTNLNGNPVALGFGPGPMEAEREFLKNNRNFVIDKSREKFYLTFNPNGYLRKIR